MFIPGCGKLHYPCDLRLIESRKKFSTDFPADCDSPYAIHPMGFAAQALGESILLAIAILACLALRC